MAGGNDRGGPEPQALRVTDTGIALVHQGEVILPAAGSEAQGELAADDARTVIEYYFPVEVEVRAAPAAVSADDIVGQTLSYLIDGLGSL
jgi:hypothetical protein